MKIAATMNSPSMAVAPNRVQMLGNTGAFCAGAARLAGAAAGVAAAALTGKGAWQLKHRVLEAGFCQLQRGHCIKA
ncbi:hypothetical protein D3C71_1518180 [compost metagenome]